MWSAVVRSSLCPQLPQNLIQLRQDALAVPLQRGDLAIVLGEMVLLLGAARMKPPAPAG